MAKKYKKSYNADSGKFENVDQNKSTPASNTRKKMKAKAAAEAKAPKPKAKPAKAKAKAPKPPIPKDRPKKNKPPVEGLQLPSNERARASVASQKLKGPVPKKKDEKKSEKKGHGIAMGKYRLK